jgi:stage IV sporulation protein FB
MFGLAGETEFDVRFQLLGIPVRIHPVFWLLSAFLVWSAAGGDLALVLLGMICVLVSILVHELGHALLSRRFGYPSEIVLYFFGGYATSSRFSTWKNVAVSAAGPAFGFALFLLTYLTYALLIENYPQVLRDNFAVFFALNIMMFANLVWNIINLVPCVPLDGGQIMQNLVMRYGRRNQFARVLQVSIISSAAVALWTLYANQSGNLIIPIPAMLLPYVNVANLQPGGMFMPIFFGYMCAQHVIQYNESVRRIL